MKTGETVFVIHHSLNIIEGVLGDETTAQGFYTRWGPGHNVYFRNAARTVNESVHNDENIFSTREAA